MAMQATEPVLASSLHVFRSKADALPGLCRSLQPSQSIGQTVENTLLGIGTHPAPGAAHDLGAFSLPVMAVRTGETIPCMQPGILVIEQLAALTGCHILHAEEAVLAQHPFAMFLLRAPPTPASFTRHFTRDGFPDMSVRTSKLMPCAAALPDSIQALPTLSVCSGFELRQATHISAFGAGNRMMRDE